MKQSIKSGQNQLAHKGQSDYQNGTGLNSGISRSKFGFPVNYLAEANTTLPSNRFPALSGNGRFIYEQIRVIVRLLCQYRNILGGQTVIQGRYVGKLIFIEQVFDGLQLAENRLFLIAFIRGHDVSGSLRLWLFFYFSIRRVCAYRLIVWGNRGHGKTHSVLG